MSLPRGVRVLIAEDDPVMLEMYREVLLGFGYVPLCAADGHEAVEIFDREHPPLVLLDVLMPNLNGLEVCRHIRTSVRGTDTFILVITVQESGIAIHSALDAGADDFLTKPITVEQLRARIIIATRTLELRLARRNAERALARAQWLAGIGETSLALQHEINNPLTAIIGSATLLETGSYSADDEQDFVRTIVEQAQRIGDVVKRLALLRNPRSVAYVRGTRMLDLSGETGESTGT
jgi:DNA-binding response OmpR family regulator